MNFYTVRVGIQSGNCGVLHFTLCTYITTQNKKSMTELEVEKQLALYPL